MTHSDYQSLFETVPDLYLILLPNLEIVTASNAYTEATLTKKEEIIGRNVFAVFPDNPDSPEDNGVSNLRKSFDFVLANKKEHIMAIQKYDVRRTDGTFEERFWRPLNKPILDENNEIKFIIHRVENVTDFVVAQREQLKKEKLAAELLSRTKELEKEISEYTLEIEKAREYFAREEKFRNTLDKMLEGVQIIDFNWNYIYVNEAVAKHGHYKKEELTGHSMLERYTGIEQSEVFQIMKKCMEERISYHMENEFNYPNSSKGWFELSIQPVPEGIFVLSIDITKRKKAEEAIKKLNENLEQKVKERTCQLEKATKEIFDNYSQLEAVNQELNAFSYSISHDLRAPLRAVNGYAIILEEDYSNLLDEDGRKVIKTIKYNAKKMGLLIDDLLEFSKLGKREIIKTNTNMKLIAEEALLEVSNSVKHHAKVHIENLHAGRADNALMKQVFVNLISNGIKYSSKKEDPVVEIKSEQKNEEVIFSVKDNGVGFDMKYVGKLFGVFQRLHSSEEFEGTGVGLAIVDRIIKKHGGRVWPESIPGEGTIFYFSLPV